MSKLYGVMSVVDLDTVWTYEADSREQAAALYLADAEPGDEVRVFLLGRHAPSYIRTTDGAVKALSNPPAVRKHG